jgi:major histocompatibility complex class I
MRFSVVTTEVAQTESVNIQSWLPGMVAHAFNPSTWEAEAGGFLSSRPAWSTE